MFSPLRRVGETAGTLGSVGALLLVGFLSGSDVLTLTFLSIHLYIFQSFLSVGAFSIFVVSTGGFLAWELWKPRERLRELTGGPPVRAVVPAHREAETLPGTVESLVESRYDGLRTTIVVEPDDVPTRERARELAARYDSVSYLINGNPGSKAGAINYAIGYHDESYIAVFDADERVSPSFVPAAMARLLDDVDVFQGRRVPRPAGAIETLAYCERVLVRAAYATGELVGFVHCQSAATVFTREAFECAGGYDDKLTEDIDFSHKCYQAGLTVERDRRVTTTIEAPHTLRDLWGQRKRWRVGHIEVTHTTAKEFVRGNHGLTESISLGRAIGGVVGGASLLIIASHVLVLLLLDFDAALMIPYVSMLGVISAVWMRDLADGVVGPPSWSLLLFPLVYLGHGVLTVKAILEFYLTWEGEWYRVTKTGP